MNFDRYADEDSARFTDSPEARRRQQRMYEKAYAPLEGPLREARRILDFGCGAGAFVDFLAGRAQGEVVGFDPSRTQLLAAKERVAGRPKITLLSEASEIPSGAFDLVFSLHVIEHVPDSKTVEYIRLLLKFLSPTGKLVISTPNGLNPFSHAYYMSADRTHVRMHSPMTLAQLIEPEGGRIESVHRETPQIYDFMTFLKTAAWWMTTLWLRIAVLSSAGGVRRHKLPFTLAPTFYIVASKAPPATS